MESSTDHKAIKYFDEVCHLCQGSVKFILKHEREPYFYFASLQDSPEVQTFSSDSRQMFATLVVYTGKDYLYKSDAVLYISAYLRFPWKMLSWFAFVPVIFRNWMYDRVARHRYRWFGTSSSCMMPLPQYKNRFLGS